MVLATTLLLVISTSADAEVIIPWSQDASKTQVMDAAQRGDRDYLVTWSKEGVTIHRRIGGEPTVQIRFEPGTWIGSRFFVRDDKVWLRTYNESRGEVLVDCDSGKSAPEDKKHEVNTQSAKYLAIQKGLLTLKPDLSSDMYDPRAHASGSPASDEVRIASFDPDDPSVTWSPLSISKDLKVMAWGGDNLDWGRLEHNKWIWKTVFPGLKTGMPRHAVLEKVITAVATENSVHFGIVMLDNGVYLWKTITVSAPWDKPTYQVRDGLVCRDLGE